MVIYSYGGDCMDKNYLVTKSNYFIMNSSYDLSLEEQKIILTLASMVQPTDEEFKPYTFKINEFMELLGVDTKTKYTEIPKITKELMKKVFEIEEGKKVIQVAWLSSVVYEKGTGMVELEFSPRLKPYMIKLGTVFTQYKLANILSMRSKYSPRIYEILKCNEFKKQGYIEIELEDLRRILSADNVYPLYNDFKRFVIQRTQKELKKLSDINFDFEEIKTGRKVTSLKFYIHSIKKNDQKNETCGTVQVPGQMKIEGAFESEEPVPIVRDFIKENITDLQIIKLLDAAHGNIELIKEKYAIAEQTSDIKNIIGWLLKAIKDDYKASEGKLNVFSNRKNFTERKYDKKFFDDFLLYPEKEQG